MIYLLSQILLCLALAALFGGAIGWLLQRSRNARRLDELHEAIELRERQLERAHTDVTMLTDDFDDLRERSRVEIDALREDNARLPVLSENLENSQLLMRQMLERHDARTRELTAASTVLEERLAQSQERAVAQDRALVKAKATATAAMAAAVAAGAAVADADADTSGTTEASDDEAGRRERESLALMEPEGVAVDETMDEVVEVDDSLAAELLDDTVDSDADDGFSTDDESGFDDDEGNATLAVEVFTMEDLHEPAATAGGETFDDVDESGRTRAPLLFRPVDRQDDLKRIFGITPVTERALNDLGITSYPQLAELERPEIEKIARALEIVPETIERDDWVGNARRQLEDVLEEL